MAGPARRLPRPSDVVDGKITLDVMPCRVERPFCGPDKKDRSSFTACWGCLGDGTHAGKPRDPDADWDDVKPVPKTSKRGTRKKAAPSAKVVPIRSKR